MSPDLEGKTFVSKILWQELGEGDPARAHETIYVSTMTEQGFDPLQFVDAPPLPATARLLAGYAEAATLGYETSLGYLFATEAADLLMVGSIGQAVRRCTGAKSLPWVDIHVTQEPDHTTSVSQALTGVLTATELEKVNAAAATMFGLWTDFFTELESRLDTLRVPARRVIEDAIA